ncbi:hypothetical protein JVT61DRAFT_10879 [Boletus reticuloceps]|uniref:Peptidase C14 caspase domain-containing protein n=1 Tax=Boletus reticuloceps TaxID=495285 RepID=A0A8I2YFY0_9AGAM|nr:hypothetical protein JVT61DRAFT_10879 [Boletus reticuloceps]
MSTQSSRGVKAVPVATASRHYHPTVAQQTTQGHRRQAYSTGNPTAPVGVNIAPSQFRKAHASNGHEYSRCTGRKKALYQWGFKDGGVVMLMDQTTNPRQVPTRKNMINAMKWLVKDTKPHDSLFFHYSGHGGQIPDAHGDKTGGSDEGELNVLPVGKVVRLKLIVLVIYPVDHKKAGVIIDDVSRDGLKSRL